MLELQPTGGTRLHDSMCHAVDDFWRHGTPSRPWTMICITDGSDNCSARSARQAGDYVRARFTKDSSNYCFVIGVGLDQHGVNALNDMIRGDTSENFHVMHLQDFDQLQLALLQITVQIVLNTQVAAAQLTDERSRQHLIAAVQRQVQLRRHAMDVFFLLDRSGSMNGAA